MNRFRFLPPTGLLAMIAGALIASLWAGAGDDELETNTLGSPPLAVPASNGGTTKLFEVSKVLEVDPVFDERPLFIQGRRAPVPQQEIEPPEPQIAEPLPTPEAEPVEAANANDAISTPLEIELEGILIDSSGRSALILNIRDGSEVWIKEGEQVGDWMLAEISQEEIRFVANGTEMTFKLFDQALP